MCNRVLIPLPAPSRTCQPARNCRLGRGILERRDTRSHVALWRGQHRLDRVVRPPEGCFLFYHHCRCCWLPSLLEAERKRVAGIHQDPGLDGGNLHWVASCIYSRACIRTELVDRNVRSKLKSEDPTAWTACATHPHVVCVLPGVNDIRRAAVSVGRNSHVGKSSQPDNDCLMSACEASSFEDVEQTRAGIQISTSPQ